MKTTGATDAQIEAAAKQWWELHHADDPEGWASWDDDRNFLIGDIQNDASYLVKPDQRIVDVADLMALWMRAGKAPNPTRESEAFLNRIAALIGGEDE